MKREREKEREREILAHNTSSRVQAEIDEAEKENTAMQKQVGVYIRT